MPEPFRGLTWHSVEEPAPIGARLLVWAEIEPLTGGPAEETWGVGLALQGHAGARERSWVLIDQLGPVRFRVLLWCDPEGDQRPGRGEWFLTFSGRQAFPLDLRPEEIVVEDIAHSLAHLCRFQGHTRPFYSVAQHSVLVAQNVPRELALVGLLHDATEAYCGDMIRPLKRSMPAFRLVEDRIWEAIASRFGLPVEMPAAVKEADTRLLQTERRDLLAPHHWPWMEDQIADNTALPYDLRIDPQAPAEAEAEWLALFHQLTSGGTHA